MRAMKVASIEQFIAADSKDWVNIPSETIEFAPTPSAQQPTEYIRVKWEDKEYGLLDNAQAAVVQDGKQIVIRLAWNQANTHMFDGAAVTFPIAGEPVLMEMGSAKAPMHALHWLNKTGKVRSVFAAGMGTTTEGPNVGQKGGGVHKDGMWQVTFVRNLGAGERVAPLVAGKKSSVAFAIWNGSNDERAGLKAFSIDWRPIEIDG